LGALFFSQEWADVFIKESFEVARGEFPIFAFRQQSYEEHGFAENAFRNGSIEEGFNLLW